MRALTLKAMATWPDKLAMATWPEKPVMPKTCLAEGPCSLTANSTQAIIRNSTAIYNLTAPTAISNPIANHVRARKLPKAFLSSRHMSNRCYYAKYVAARGRGARSAEAAICGSRWNHYLETGMHTPHFRPHEHFRVAIVSGLMANLAQSTGDTNWAHGAGLGYAWQSQGQSAYWHAGHGHAGHQVQLSYAMQNAGISGTQITNSMTTAMQPMNAGIEMENPGCTAGYAGAQQVLFSVSISNFPSAGTTANTGNRSGAGNNRMAAVENVQLVFSAFVNVPERAGQTLTAIMASNASFPATAYLQAYQAHPAAAGQGLEIAAGFEPQEYPAGAYAGQAVAAGIGMPGASGVTQGSTITHAYAAGGVASRIATTAVLHDGAAARQGGTGATIPGTQHVDEEKKRIVTHLIVTQADATPE